MTVAAVGNGRRVTRPGTGARTERDVLELHTGCFTLRELYAAVEAADLTARDDGERIVAGVSDTRWRRRVRGVLQTLKRQGHAERAGDQLWILHGRPDAPAAAVLVSMSGRYGDVDLRLERAAELLTGLSEPADLILTDPPYALGVSAGYRCDTGARVYARDDSRVVAGYVDVNPADYRAFTTEWVTAAAAAIRPGGYLAVITGPQQAAWVQVSAENAGLTFVNCLAVGRVFALRSTRRFAHAHWTVTVICQGPLTSRRRAFTTPPDLPKAASGADYPLDLWPTGSVGRADAARGELRYPNTLPVRLVDRLTGALTRPATSEQRDLLVDPFLGGGTTALVARRRGLRFLGADVNPKALTFTARRLSRDILDAPAALTVTSSATTARP